MSARSLHIDRRASAGAEMALVLPLLLVLLLGSVELGNLFLSQISRVSYSFSVKLSTGTKFQCFKTLESIY